MHRIVTKQGRASCIGSGRRRSRFSRGPRPGTKAPLTPSQRTSWVGLAWFVSLIPHFCHPCRRPLYSAHPASSRAPAAELEGDVDGKTPHASATIAQVQKHSMPPRTIKMPGSLSPSTRPVSGASGLTSSMPLRHRRIWSRWNTCVTTCQCRTTANTHSSRSN